MYGLIPFREEKNMFRYLDDLERSFWGNVGEGVSQFRTDVIDQGDHFLLQAELPGFDKKEIEVAIEDGNLIIQAQHEEKGEDKKKNFIRRERKFGSFSRSFGLSGIDPDQITAAYQNGVLGISLPKTALKRENPVKKITVQ
ncbi:MAG: Hsp20/alpha crystallin family protein [Oscillospiraceae bacterium]|nr:Hsp20/alpha crystallin family protein [Oscillospiraceae bacterium]